MLNVSKPILHKILKNGLTQSEFNSYFLFDDNESLTLDILASQGLRLFKKDDHFYLPAFEEKISKQVFCIVDIETNGSKKDRDQVIEIGAVKIQGKKTLGTFNTLIKADILPTVISELTGITLDELFDAPSLKSVMHDFRLFLADSIFVAHALKFDYEFISEMFERADLGQMLNPGLCTIDLAERTFSSAKYGLSYLNKTLHFEKTFQQHRALNDAKITQEIFRYSLKRLPRDIKSTGMLIKFSKEQKRMPKAPLIIFEEA